MSSSSSSSEQQQSTATSSSWQRRRTIAWSLFTTVSTIATIGTYMYTRKHSSTNLSLTAFLTKTKNNVIIQLRSLGPLRYISYQIEKYFQGRLKRGIVLSIILVWLSLKYQQYLRRAFRRMLRGDPTPSDVLNDYPGSDEDLAAAHQLENASSSSSSLSLSTASNIPPLHSLQPSLASSSEQNLHQSSTNNHEPIHSSERINRLPLSSLTTTTTTTSSSSPSTAKTIPPPVQSVQSSFDRRNSKEGSTLQRSYSNPSFDKRYRADSKDIVDKENLALILASSSVAHNRGLPLVSWLPTTVNHNRSNTRSTSSNNIGLSMGTDDQQKDSNTNTTTAVENMDPSITSGSQPSDSAVPADNGAEKNTLPLLSSPDESNPTTSITMETPPLITDITVTQIIDDNTRSKEMNNLLYFFRIMRNILQGADTDAILDLYPLMERIRVGKGDILFRQNEDSEDGMYIILQGSIGVYNDGNNIAPDTTTTTTGVRPATTTVQQRPHSVKFSNDNESPRKASSSSVTNPLPIGTLLGIFRTGQTIGENTLLASSYKFSTLVQSDGVNINEDGKNVPVATTSTANTNAANLNSSAVFSATLRPVTAIAIEESIVLRLTRVNFAKFTLAHPNAVVSFILTTTARQFRVAYFTLVDFLHLSEAWRISIEAPGYYSAFRWTSDDDENINGTMNNLDPMYRSLTIPNESITTNIHSNTTNPTLPNTMYSPSVNIPLSVIRDAANSVVLKQPGEIIYTEGAVADCLYILLAGTAKAIMSSIPTFTASTVCPHCRNENLSCTHPFHHNTGIVSLSQSVLSSSSSSSSSSFVSHHPHNPSDSHIRIIGPGCIAGSQGVFVGMPYRETLIATSAVQLAVFTRTTFTTFAESDIGYRELVYTSSSALIATSPSRTSTSSSTVLPSTPVPKRRYDRAYALGEITLAVSRSLVPILHMFLRLGLVRLWLKSGEVLFRTGDVTDGLYVVISGRLRTYRGGPEHQHHHPSSSLSHSLPSTTTVHSNMDAEENSENDDDDDDDDDEENRDPDRLHGTWSTMNIPPSKITNPSLYVSQGLYHPSGSHNTRSVRPTTKLSSYLSLDIDSVHHAGHEDDIEQARNPAGGLLGEFIDVDKVPNADYQVGIRRNESAALSPISPNDNGKTNETKILTGSSNEPTQTVPVHTHHNPTIHRKWTNKLTINPSAPITIPGTTTTINEPSKSITTTTTTTIPKPSPLLSMTSTVDTTVKEPLFETLPENIAPFPSSSFIGSSSLSSSATYPSSSQQRNNKHDTPYNSNTSFFTGNATVTSEIIRVDASRGETVGELSVLTCAPYRSNTAVCFRDCELVKISPAAFDLIATKYPFVMNQFVRVLARKYEATLAKGGRNVYGSSSSSTSSFGTGDTNWNTNTTAASLASMIIAQYRQYHSSSTQSGLLPPLLSTSYPSSVVPPNVTMWPYRSSVFRHSVDSSLDNLYHISSSLMTPPVLSPRIVPDTLRIPHRSNGKSARRKSTEPVINPEAVAASIAATAAAAIPYLISPTNAAFTLPSPNGQRFVTIAIVPAGGNPIGLSDFTVRLVNALNRMNEGSVLHLNSASLNLYFGSGTKERLSQLFVRAKVASWLSAQEEKYRFIVFEADPDEDENFTNTTDRRSSYGGNTDIYYDHHYPHLPYSSDSRIPDANFTPWEVSQRVTHRMLQGVKNASTSLEAGMRNIGRGLDTAVRNRLGFHPSSLLHHRHTSSSRRTSAVSSSDPSSMIHTSHTTATSTHVSEVTAWNKLCVQQADLCLLVAQAHTSPSLSAIEASIVYKSGKLQRTTEASVTTPGPSLDSKIGATPTSKLVMSRTACRKELVLLHYDPTRRPQGTRTWLRERRVAVHHHIRTWIRRQKGTTGTLPSDIWTSRSSAATTTTTTNTGIQHTSGDDYDRLARHICGKSRGLVLGGGGSRGLGHLGVFHELEQRNIDVDVIGGTSQGAFMAACYALTLDYARCVPMAQKLAVSIGSTWNLVTSLTLPILSYFSGHALNEILIDIFGDVQIEDTYIRYFCVTTNVTDACMSVHVTGPLWRYVRASMTVMGLLPPVIAHHRLLIDGGYSNNLPLDVLRSIAPQVGTIICVDVENKDNSLFEGIDDPGDSISGWYIAYKWLLAILHLSEPLRIPPLSEISLKISYIAHSMQIRDVLANADERIVYIRPDVGSKYGLLDYHKMDQIVSKGKEAAQRILDRRTHRELVRITRQVRRFIKFMVLTQLRQEKEEERGSNV